MEGVIFSLMKVPSLFCNGYHFHFVEYLGKNECVSGTCVTVEVGDLKLNALSLTLTNSLSLSTTHASLSVFYNYTFHTPSCAKFAELPSLSLHNVSSFLGSLLLLLPSTLFHFSRRIHMGCCVSTPRDLSSASSPPKCQNSVVRKNQLPPRSNSSSSVKASENRAPPEEETVKEVLPETHKLKPRIAHLEPQKPPLKPEFNKFPEVSSKINKMSLPVKKDEEISEVSEVCSLSESLMSNTTIAERKEEEDELRRRVCSSPAKMRKNRSFSGERREMTVGKSPSRRPEQSPGRRNIGSARSTPTRDQLVRSQTMGNRGMINEPRGRHAGENSCRRSRSPAMRSTDNGATRSVMGRSPSRRRPNQSPARARTPTPENGCRRKEHPGTEGKWPSSTVNESLENPLVSLECFIFL